MPSEELVVLVDKSDRRVGVSEKMAAHQQGQLHRAFSVFLFDHSGRWLLQQRALHKYHSGGLWTNTCCSHPHPGEAPPAAARRRLREELGMECPVFPAFSFLYRAGLDGGLIEYEYDHVFVGRCDDAPTPDPAEVRDTRWVEPEALQCWLESRPWEFTYWFRAVHAKVLEYSVRWFDHAEQPAGRHFSLLSPPQALVHRPKASEAP